MSGDKIIEGLKEAVAGDLSRVTIDGQVWTRQRPDLQKEADVSASDDIRAAIRALDAAVRHARSRGLTVSLQLGGLGYESFEPCSTAVCMVTRTALI